MAEAIRWAYWLFLALYVSRPDNHVLSSRGRIHLLTACPDRVKSIVTFEMVTRTRQFWIPVGNGLFKSCPSLLAQHSHLSSFTSIGLFHNLQKYNKVCSFPTKSRSHSQPLSSESKYPRLRLVSRIPHIHDVFHLPSSRDINPLSTSLNPKDYPRLTSLFIQYLSIPITSQPPSKRISSSTNYQTCPTPPSATGTASQETATNTITSGSKVARKDLAVKLPGR